MDRATRSAVGALTYDVVFAADANYAPHLSVAILSLIQSNQHRQFIVHLIHSDISIQDLQLLSAMVSSYSSEFRSYRISTERFRSAPTPSHLKKSTYYRLLIPNIIEADIALYLDSDLVVLGSLDDLLDCDVKGRLLAASSDLDARDNCLIELADRERYFNAGVMLINNHLWRQNGIAEKVDAFIDHNRNLLKYGDQCALNAVVKGNWVEVSAEYNFQLKSECSEIQHETSYGRPKIIHFTGSIKPWHTVSRHPYKSLYWKYRRQSPYRRIFPDDISSAKLLRRMCPDFLRRILKN